jgi:carboxyl-terminal processing protease
MANRISTAVVLLALAAVTPAQSVRSKVAPKFSGPDPFTIDVGSTFSASSTTKRNAESSTVTASSVVSDVQEALTLIKRNHVKAPGNGTLANSSIDSMLKSLDPHSSYYDRAEFAALLDEQRSEYFGTGSSLGEYERDGRYETFVLSAFPETAAHRAGLRFGDKIVAVDGSSVADLGSTAIRDRLRGPKGTNVSVTLERAGKTFTVTLKRDRVPQSTVTDSYILGDGVGLIRMPDGFSFTSFSEFETAFRGLKSQGMTSLVLDLRGNPGGILDQSVKIAEKFLPEGSVIVSQKGRFQADNRAWRSTNRSPETLPIVVLVDGDSASAAEVVAGALQDNDRAVIVGEKTFGKGLVQSVLDLPSGGGLTLTTGRYYTPSGRSLQRDYQHNGAYDYYNHAAGTAISSEPSLTRTKRQVYGGDGITPDVRVAPETVTRQRIALLDPIFHFARNMAASGQLEITDEKLAAFRNFTRDGWGIPENRFAREEQFIRLRLTHDFALASGGPTAASRSLLKSDQTLAKAIQAMPQAVSFASSYYTAKNPAKK